MSGLRINIDRLTVVLGGASLDTAEALAQQLESAISARIAESGLQPESLASADLREIQLAPIHGPMSDGTQLADTIAERLLQHIATAAERGM